MCKSAGDNAGGGSGGHRQRARWRGEKGGKGTEEQSKSSKGRAAHLASWGLGIVVFCLGVLWSVGVCLPACAPLVPSTTFQGAVK